MIYKLLTGSKKIKTINKAKKKLLVSRVYNKVLVKGLDYDIKKIW